MRGASVLACRVVAPHLPRADTNLSTKGRNLSEPKSGGVHLQAVGRACSSSRHAWAAGRTALASPSEIEQAAAVRMVARRCACALGLGGGSRLTGVLVLGHAEIRYLPSTAKYDSNTKSAALTR